MKTERQNPAEELPEKQFELKNEDVYLQLLRDIKTYSLRSIKDIATHYGVAYQTARWMYYSRLLRKLSFLKIVEPEHAIIEEMSFNDSVKSVYIILGILYDNNVLYLDLYRIADTASREKWQKHKLLHKRQQELFAPVGRNAVIYILMAFEWIDVARVDEVGDEELIRLVCNNLAQIKTEEFETGVRHANIKDKDRYRLLGTEYSWNTEKFRKHTQKLMEKNGVVFSDQTSLDRRKSISIRAAITLLEKHGYVIKKP